MQYRIKRYRYSKGFRFHYRHQLQRYVKAQGRMVWQTVKQDIQVIDG